MANLRKIVDGHTTINASGTSEGATKGWDARGRGRAVLEKHGFKLGQLPAKVRPRLSKRTFTSRQNVYQHTDPQMGKVRLHPDGSWEHHVIGEDGPIETGSGAEDLHDHLSDMKDQLSRLSDLEEP